MTDNDIAISVRNLTKTYRLFRNPMDRIKCALTLGQGKFHDEYTALNNVSFDIKKGETVGIIGRNGSGKSTLLQLICGILKPTAGAVHIDGRISALLELGAGFNPEFTGRENVFFQGALMGFSLAQMSICYDDIISFADIGDFINQPVRTYSSGMFVRLAFSVAIHVMPDILIIDEALAVGDYDFQSKCMTVFRKFRERGGTTLLVSHDINSIKALSDKCIYLTAIGKCVVGSAGEVSDRYLRDTFPRKKNEGKASELIATNPISATHDELFKVNFDFARNVAAFRQGSGEVRAMEVEFLDNDGHPLTEAYFGQRIIIRLHIEFFVPCAVLAAYYVRDDKHLPVIGSSTLLEEVGLLQGEAGDKMIIEFQTELPLTDGSYSIQTQLAMPLIENVSSHIVDYVENAASFTVGARRPIKIWSKTYTRNFVTVTNVLKS